MAGGTIIYTPQSLESKFAEAKEIVRQLAVKMGITDNPEDLVIRDLEPTDLGATDKVFEQSLTTAGAYNTVYTTKLGTDKVIGIFGVLVTPTTTSTMMKFRDQSKTKNIIDIEKAKYTEDGLIIFDTVIAYGKNATIYIDAYVPQGATVPTTDKIIILGVVAENPQASEISPDQTL